jgi:hypothetical protein
MSVVKANRRIVRAKNTPPRSRLDAEADAALRAEMNRRLVDAFGGAEQVPAVHPRRRHRERGDDQRHLPAGDDQIGRRAFRIFRDASQPTTRNAPYIAATATRAGVITNGSTT